MSLLNYAFWTAFYYVLRFSLVREGYLDGLLLHFLGFAAYGLEGGEFPFDVEDFPDSFLLLSLHVVDSGSDGLNK